MNEIIQQLFSTDHMRLDTLFNFYLQNKNKNSELAQRAFEKFSEGLIRHIAQEEQILFPEYERATGLYDRGPTFVMRQEHDMIKQMLSTIAEGLDEQTDTAATEAELVSLLMEHNLKEERVLYPHCDNAIQGQRLQEVLLQI